MKTLSKNRLTGYLAMGTILLVVLACGLYLGGDQCGSGQSAGQFLAPCPPWRARLYRRLLGGAPHILIQTSGEIWREFRNIILVVVTPWLNGVVLAAIVIFHLFTGGEELPEPKSGIMLKRYSLWERVLHWYVAVLFIIMAITGLSLLCSGASPCSR